MKQSYFHFFNSAWLEVNFYWNLHKEYIHLICSNIYHTRISLPLITLNKTGSLLVPINEWLQAWWNQRIDNRIKGESDMCMAHGPMAVLFNDDQSKYMGKFSCINSDVNCDTVFYRYLYVRVTVWHSPANNFPLLGSMLNNLLSMTCI